MISIPNKVLFEEVERSLSEGKSVKIVVKGTSMSPLFISDKDYVVLSPLDKSKKRVLSRGDIVLFHIGDSLRLHRLIHYYGTLLEIRGDGCYSPYEKATTSDVIGLVTEGTCRGGKPFRADTLSWKVISWSWMHSYFIRHQMVRAKRVLRKIF